MESIILENSELEVIMFGDYVGVCWNLRMTEKQIAGEDDLVKIWERVGMPYIDFVGIREYDGKMYRNDDGPVDGGFDVRAAKQIIGELEEAIKFLIVNSFI